MQADIEIVRKIAAEDGVKGLEEIDGGADALRADLYRRSMDWLPPASKARRKIEWRLKGMSR